MDIVGKGEGEGGVVLRFDRCRENFDISAVVRCKTTPSW